jgi:putative sterol carrier protein
VEKFPFLSDEWTSEVKRLHDKVVTEPAGATGSVRMNLILTESPFDKGTIDAHLDTSSGDIVIDTGHLDSADLTVTVDYDTAKAILVDGDAQAAMQAFMSGRIKIDGDVGQLLALQSAPVDPVHQELARQIREITA